MENGIISYTLHHPALHFLKNTASNMRPGRVSEVPLKHFQRHFHRIQMYITPQSSLKPTDGITWVLLLLMLHSDKNTFLYTQLASHYRWDTCISGYLFYIISSKWFLPRNTTNNKKKITKIMKVSNSEIN